MYVANCKESEILCFVLASNLISENRRHKTTGSEIKDFITHNTADSTSFMSTWVLLAHESPMRAVWRDPGGYWNTQ